VKKKRSPWRLHYEHTRRFTRMSHMTTVRLGKPRKEENVRVKPLHSNKVNKPGKEKK